MITLEPPTSRRIIKVSSQYEKLEVQRVLVLEDDKGFADVLRSYLESLLYNVTTVTNGVDGLKEIMARKFDVVLCDMMMPKLPGDMFFRAVERVKPELCKRFIFITAHNTDPNVARFIRSIKGTILPKPFYMDDLREAISFMLGQD
jgi:CheY-like chemotaxis protein